MTFASIETRINNATLAHLANVAAMVGGTAVAGIFDAAYAEAFGIDGSQPTLLCASTAVATAVRGTAVVVGAVNYTVQGVEPDGTGLTRLFLDRV